MLTIVALRLNVAEGLEMDIRRMEVPEQVDDRVGGGWLVLGVKNVSVRRDTAADSESIPGVSTIVLARRLRDGHSTVSRSTSSGASPRRSRLKATLDSVDRQLA